MESDEFNFEIFSSLSEIYNASIELDNNVKNIAFVKPTKVIGKNVVFRNVNKADAEFILQLRTDPEKGKYLSATATDLDLQLAWLGKYAEDNSQIYFIIEDKNGERYGTIRLYDVRGDSFCWGSWILRDGRPSGFAMESAILVYQFALSLGFKKSHFDVRKENVSVWQFHERFGAVRIEEQGEDYIYSISHEAIENSFEKYKKYINDEMEIYS
jgi:RimJ/RimL family protein N-acetyltransferase